MKQLVELRHSDWVRLAALLALSVALILVFGLAASLAPVNAGADGEPLRFELMEEDVHQRLELRMRSDDSMDVVIDKQAPCIRHVSGIAHPTEEAGDMDIEVDPTGEGYPVDTFLIEGEGDCTIRIRLALGDHPFVWLKEWGCSSTCPLSEMPMPRQ